MQSAPSSVLLAVGLLPGPLSAASPAGSGARTGAQCPLADDSALSVASGAGSHTGPVMPSTLHRFGALRANMV